MDKNYIKFYEEDNKPIVKIHKNGTSRKFKNRNNIRKLIEICMKYGIDFNTDLNITITDNVLLISHEFEEYLKIKKRNKIQVVGEIDDDMKISKKDMTIGKILITSTLSFLIGATLINTIKDISSSTKAEMSTSQYKVQVETTTEDTEDDDIIELVDGQLMGFKTSTNTDAEEKSSYELQEGEDIVEKIETDGGTINIIGDENENQAEEEINDKNELSLMFTPVDFHFTCNEPIDINAMNNAKRYDDLFEKYGNDYGIDKLYAECSAAQETNGEHYMYTSVENSPYAIGIMQIERTNLDKGKYIEAYNFTTGQIDKVELTTENATDLEKNIQMGIMMKQIALKRNNYNILVGTQEYNMGCGNMDTIMGTCSSLEGIKESDLRNNLDNQEWLNYREFLGVGDPKYIEHNFRYLPDGYTIKIRRVDNGQYETLTIHNDTEKTKEY